MKLVEMDRHVSIRDQMTKPQLGPVVLINAFTVLPEEADALLKAWAHDAEIMKRQPGFISTQLLRGIGGSGQFLNYAVWESVDAFQRAFTNPEFQAQMKNYPPSATAAPHLFTKVAVPGICVG